MSPKPFFPMTPTLSNTYFPRTARLPFTPRIKSKLSILLYDSSDLEINNHKSLNPSRDSSSDEIDALVKKTQPRKPISRLSFPFVKSAKSPSASKAVKVVSPPLPSTPLCSASRLESPSTPLTQAAGFPSPSSSPVVKLQAPSPNSHHKTQRQKYHHRGYSRHALAHVKWFWVMREEDWETKTGRPIRLNKPQLDESFLETALDDPLASTLDAHKRRTPLDPVHQPQVQLPPMTIHPRRGDLESLRDPYCAGVDRSFAVLPMWTIQKTLWMYDVHLASRDRLYLSTDPVDVSDPYDDTESESESTDAYASSVGYSDDSDMTLVDSETESELPPGGVNSSGDIRGQLSDEKRFMFSYDTYPGPTPTIIRGPVRKPSDIELVLPAPFQSSWPRSAYSEPSLFLGTSGSGKPFPRTPSWSTDWYQRWGYMIEVSQRGRSPDGKPNKKSKFFIGQEEDYCQLLPRPIPHDILHRQESFISKNSLG